MPSKTHFPHVLGLVLIGCFLTPLRALQKLCSHSERALVLFFEAEPKLPGVGRACPASDEECGIVSTSILSQFGIDDESVDRDVKSAGLAIIRPPQSFTDTVPKRREPTTGSVSKHANAAAKRAFAPADLAAGPSQKLTIRSKTVSVRPTRARLLQTISFDPSPAGSRVR